MSCRFYTCQSFDVPWLTLDGEEAHHLRHVLRLKPGDEVVLFDGCGGEARARIRITRKQDAELEILSRRMTPPAPHRLTLATAVPKGDRFGWLVEKATELGVDRLIPLQTERSIVDPRDGKLARMRQAVIAACKQSGRNFLMEIAPTCPFPEFLERELSGGCLVVADPSGGPCPPDLLRTPPRLLLAIGPEGGWSPDELSRATQQGGHVVRLGDTILRMETAAVSLAAMARWCRSG
jgi:16S rRNA (uracil1498-N3)-methyltransferase